MALNPTRRARVALTVALALGLAGLAAGQATALVGAQPFASGRGDIAFVYEAGFVGKARTFVFEADQQPDCRASDSQGFQTGCITTLNGYVKARCAFETPKRMIFDAFFSPKSAEIAEDGTFSATTRYPGLMSSRFTVVMRGTFFSRVVEGDLVPFLVRGTIRVTEKRGRRTCTTGTRRFVGVTMVDEGIPTDG